jgi:hypothetical protein
MQLDLDALGLVVDTHLPDRLSAGTPPFSAHPQSDLDRVALQEQDLGLRDRQTGADPARPMADRLLWQSIRPAAG